MNLMEALSVAVAVVALIGAFAGVIRWSLNLQKVALERVAALEQRLALMELRSVSSDALNAALDKLLAVIERRIDGMDGSFRAIAQEVHALRIQVAVLNDREHVTDFGAHNRKIMEGASRG